MNELRARAISQEKGMYKIQYVTEVKSAVLRALADGIPDAARLASYRKLKAENDYAADSSRYLEIKKSRFKEISKVNKSRRK